MCPEAWGSRLIRQRTPKPEGAAPSLLQSPTELAGWYCGYTEGSLRLSGLGIAVGP